jgi:hypothetical protein
MIAGIGITVPTGIMGSGNVLCMGCGVTEWMGKGVALIQAGRGKVSPYFQNQWIAAISLMGVSALLMRCTVGFGVWATDRDIVKKSSIAVEDITFLTIWGGTFIGGVVAFSKFMQLPFGKVAQTAMVVAGVFIYVALIHQGIINGL